MTVESISGSQFDSHLSIGFDSTDTVNTGNACDNYYIFTFKKRPGRRMTHSVDLFVNRSVFLDICISPWNIGFRLVIIVIRNKILDRVVWEKPSHLAKELGG